MNPKSSYKLNSGNEMPYIGLGTYLSQPGAETIEAVEYALELGYRHIDTAAVYKNESDVGKAIVNSGIKREEIFVTTKLWNTDQGYNSALRAFDKSLELLGMDYVDLYLIHWPLEMLRHDSWKALLKIYQDGRAKSIGVSNYTVRHLVELCQRTDILPAVNQVEFSPFLYQKELLDYCNEKGIALSAYSPLVRGRKFNDERLIALAEKYGKTPAQMLIKWCLQHNTIVLPKSATKSRIKENFDIFDFEISAEDITAMNAFNENYRVAWDPSEIN